MGTRFGTPQFAYGVGDNLIQLAPRPIVSPRSPTTNDHAEIGTTWVNTVANSVWCLTSIKSNVAYWETSPASGVGTFTSVDVTGGNVHLTAAGGSIVVDNGDLTLTAGNASIGGNLTVVGNCAVTGDFDITDTASISLTSTNNAANAIYLHANGGINETIVVRADQGTGTASVQLLSDVGGVTLTGGLGTANAIVFANTDLAGGWTATLGTGGANVTTTGAVVLAAAASSSLSTTGAGIDTTIASAGGQSIISSGKAAADSVYLHATDAAGGITLTSGTGAITAGTTGNVGITSTGNQVILTSTKAAANSLRFNASNAAGGIDIDCGTGGATLDSTGVISLDAAAASNFTTTGASIDLTLSSVGGSVNLAASEAAADAIKFTASDAAGGLTISTGTAGITSTSTGKVSFGAAAASDITVTGAFDLTLTTTLGVNHLTSGKAAANAIDITASDAAGGIDMNCGTGGATLDSTGAISFDAAAASNFTVTGAFDLTLSTTLGSTVITGGEAAVDAITITAGDAAGGIDMNCGTGGATLDSTGSISIDAAAASNFTVTGAFDLTASSTAGSVIVSGGEAVVDAVQITASAGAGGVTIATGTGGLTMTTGGVVSMPGGTDTQASPSATATINKNVGVATFTGFTTASAAAQVFTITNSLVSATSSIFVTASNLGANDAQMTITRVKQGAGAFEVTLTNNGGAALNGNVMISFWVHAA